MYHLCVIRCCATQYEFQQSDHDSEGSELGSQNNLTSTNNLHIGGAFAAFGVLRSLGMKRKTPRTSAPSDSPI